MSRSASIQITRLSLANYQWRETMAQVIKETGILVLILVTAIGLVVMFSDVSYEQAPEPEVQSKM
jgi:hypothetical protein